MDILFRIRADERLAGARVIAATACPHLAEALRNEADCILTQPVNLTVLKDSAQRLPTVDSQEKPDTEAHNA